MKLASRDCASERRILRQDKFNSITVNECTRLGNFLFEIIYVPCAESWLIILLCCCCLTCILILKRLMRRAMGMNCLFAILVETVKALTTNFDILITMFQ